MDQKNDDVNGNEVEPTAKAIITVTDGGDFGFTSCGRCGMMIDESSTRCPHCGIKLKGTILSPSFGGSDFE